MNTFMFIAQIILIAMFAFSAGSKFFRAKTMVSHWKEYRYQFWFMHMTATFETVGMLGILAGFWYPVLLKYGAALLAVLMLGAIHAHLFRAKHNPIMAINAFVMLVLSILLIVL